MNWADREIYEKKRSMLKHSYLNYLEDYLNNGLYKDKKSFEKFQNMGKLLRGEINGSLSVLGDVERILQQIKFQIDHERRKMQPIKSIIELLESDSEDEIPEKNGSDSDTSFREPSPICVMDIEEMRRKEEEAKKNQDNDSDSDCEIIEVNKEDSIIVIRESPEREIPVINEDSNSKESRNSSDSIPRPRSPIINVPKTTNDNSFCDSVLSALRAEISGKEATTEKENNTQNVSYLPSTSSGLINRFAADQRKQISETTPVEEEDSEDDDDVVDSPETTRPGTYGQQRKSISEELNPLSSYKLKKTALKPASHYAKPKPTNQVRKTLSVKEKPVDFRPRFNPIDEAVAVSKIKQRLYQKTYLDPNNIVKQIAAGKVKPTKDAIVENDDSRESIENSPENSQDSASEILDTNKNKNLIKDYIKNRNYRKQIARESRLEKKKLSEKNHTKVKPSESKTRKTSEKSKTRKSSESDKKSSERSKKLKTGSLTKTRNNNNNEVVSSSEAESEDTTSSIPTEGNDNNSEKSFTTNPIELPKEADPVMKFVSMSIAQNIDIVLVKIVDIFVTDYLAGRATLDKIKAFQGLVGQQKYAEIMKQIEERKKIKTTAAPESDNVTDKNEDDDKSSSSEEEEEEEEEESEKEDEDEEEKEESKNNEDDAMTEKEEASTSRDLIEMPVENPTAIPHTAESNEKEESENAQLPSTDNIEESVDKVLDIVEPAENQPINEIDESNQSSTSRQSVEAPESVNEPAKNIPRKRGRPRKVAFVEQPVQEEKAENDPEGLLELLPEKPKKGRRKTVDSLIYDVPLTKRRQSCDTRKRRISNKDSNSSNCNGSKKKKNEEELVIKTEPVDSSFDIVFKTEKEFDEIVNDFPDDIEETLASFKSGTNLQKPVA